MSVTHGTQNVPSHCPTALQVMISHKALLLTQGEIVITIGNLRKAHYQGLQARSVPLGTCRELIEIVCGNGKIASKIAEVSIFCRKICRIMRENVPEH